MTSPPSNIRPINTIVALNRALPLDYEYVVPTLKSFSSSTFFTNFLCPLTYDQLEAREGVLGASYCPDLLDLLSGLLSYMGNIEPPLFFDAKPEALAAILIQGCHLPPDNSLLGLFSTQMELHESPADYYTRLSLRIPDFRSLWLKLFWFECPVVEFHKRG